MTPAHVAHIMALVNDYAIAVASVAHEMSDKNDFLKLNSARAAVEAALRGAAQADPVAWHVNFRGSSHLLTSLESVDLTDCIVTPLYPEPRAPDNTLKDRLLAALERAAGAESALRRLADKTEPLTQTRGYHALVQVIYELQQDGNYSDEEGEETSALVELLRAIEATPSAPTAVEPTAEQSSVVEPYERAMFEAWCALDNPKYHPTDDGICNRRDWKVWQAARASKGTK